VHLACGRYEANVAGIDAEDFSPIPASAAAPASRGALILLRHGMNNSGQPLH